MKNESALLFTITPRPRKGRYALASDSLSFTIWYRKAEDAAGYARSPVEVVRRGGELTAADL